MKLRIRRLLARVLVDEQWERDIAQWRDILGWGGADGQDDDEPQDRRGS